MSVPPKLTPVKGLADVPAVAPLACWAVLLEVEAAILCCVLVQSRGHTAPPSKDAEGEGVVYVRKAQRLSETKGVSCAVTLASCPSHGPGGWLLGLFCSRQPLCEPHRDEGCESLVLFAMLMLQHVCIYSVCILGAARDKEQVYVSGPKVRVLGQSLGQPEPAAYCEVREAVRRRS